MYGAHQRLRYSQDEIVLALSQVIESRNVNLDRVAAEAGLSMLRRGGDFADGVVLHEAERAQCDHLVTFDRGFAQRSDPDRVVVLSS